MPELKCPGCHAGDFPDFDHYCQANGITPEEAPAAFASFIFLSTGTDVRMERVLTLEERIAAIYTTCLNEWHDSTTDFDSDEDYPVICRDCLTDVENLKVYYEKGLYHD